MMCAMLIAPTATYNYDFTLHFSKNKNYSCYADNTLLVLLFCPNLVKEELLGVKPKKGLKE